MFSRAKSNESNTNKSNTNLTRGFRSLFRSKSNSKISPCTSPTPPSPASAEVKKLFCFASATTAGTGGFRLQDRANNSVTDYIEAIKEERENRHSQENKTTIPKSDEELPVDNDVFTQEEEFDQYYEANLLLEQMRREQAEDNNFSISPVVATSNDIFEF